DRIDEVAQLVEVQLPDLVQGLAADGEEHARRADPRTVAVRTDVLAHHLVEPLLHSRVGLAALAVAAIPALDTRGDARETDFPADLGGDPLSTGALDAGRFRELQLLRLD